MSWEVVLFQIMPAQVIPLRVFKLLVISFTDRSLEEDGNTADVATGFDIGNLFILRYRNTVHHICLYPGAGTKSLARW